MKRQMAKMICYGTYTVIHDDEATDEPYIIYKSWQDGRRHKKMVGKYYSLASCMRALSDVANREMV